MHKCSSISLSFLWPSQKSYMHERTIISYPRSPSSPGYCLFIVVKSWCLETGERSSTLEHLLHCSFPVLFPYSSEVLKDRLQMSVSYEILSSFIQSFLDPHKLSDMQRLGSVGVGGNTLQLAWAECKNPLSCTCFKSFASQRHLTVVIPLLKEASRSFLLITPTSAASLSTTSTPQPFLSQARKCKKDLISFLSWLLRKFIYAKNPTIKETCLSQNGTGWFMN